MPDLKIKKAISQAMPTKYPTTLNKEIKGFPYMKVNVPNIIIIRLSSKLSQDYFSLSVLQPQGRNVITLCSQIDPRVGAIVFFLNPGLEISC